MSLLAVDATTVERLLPLRDAIDVLEQGFAAGIPGDPLRTAVEAPAGQLLLMPSVADDAVGVKIVSVGPGDPGRGVPRIQGVYLLLDSTTLAPRAVLDGGALTSLRTPAASAVATRRLASPGARKLVVFGAGPQAWGHIRAMAAVRPIEQVVVVSRTPSRAAELAARTQGAGLDAAAGQPADVRDADIVCTCTTAREPVFDSGLLQPWAHVNAVGSHEPAAREVDTALVRAAQIAVETRAAALAEAGDLLVPLSEGDIGEEALRWDLAQLVTGDGPEPRADQLSLYKSVGIAYEDLVIAAEIVRRHDSGSG